MPQAALLAGIEQGDPTRHYPRQEHTVATPLEARCDHCKQTRPVFLYEPDHDFHLTGITCEWCARDKQPLLCTRCWSTEKEREENAPVPAEDQAAANFLVRICENNRRYAEQTDADKATCDGIAQASTDPAA